MTSPTPDGESRRDRIEQASVPVLQSMSRVPRLLVVAVVGGGVLAAFLVDSRWSALALLPALLFLGWLSYLAWPRLGRGPRALRMLVLGLLTAWVATRLVT